MDPFVLASAGLSLLAAGIASWSFLRSSTAIAEANDPRQLVRLKELVAEYDRALTETLEKHQAAHARARKRLQTFEKHLAQQVGAEPPDQDGEDPSGAQNGTVAGIVTPQQAREELLAVARAKGAI